MVETTKRLTSISEISPALCKIVRVLCTDMDGTFMLGNSIPEPAMRAYRRAVKSGLRVIPCTGRTLACTKTTLAKQGMIGEFQLFPGIYLNGCCVYGDVDASGAPEVIFEALLDPTLVCKIYEMIQKFNKDAEQESEAEKERHARSFAEGQAARDPHLGPPLWSDVPNFTQVVERPTAAFTCYCSDSLVTDVPNDMGVSVVHFGEMEPEVFEGGNFATLLSDNFKVNKLMLLFRSVTRQKQFREILSRDFAATDCELLEALPWILEVVPKDVSKGRGLQMLSRKIGFSMESICGLGDGENDAALLQCCPVSIAMGGSFVEKNAKARFVTKSIGDDGWSHAVNTILDKQKG